MSKTDTALLTARSTMPDGTTVVRTLATDATVGTGYVVRATYDDGDVTVIRRAYLSDAVAAWGGSFLTSEQVATHTQRVAAHLAGHPVG